MASYYVQFQHFNGGIQCELNNEFKGDK